MSKPIGVNIMRHWQEHTRRYPAAFPVIVGGRTYDAVEWLRHCKSCQPCFEHAIKQGGLMRALLDIAGGLTNAK